MGIAFVIILHLVAIFIVSIIIAIAGFIITYFLSKKEKRKRNIWTAMISPFVGFYTLYFCGLFGSIIVSEVKNVDVGIGDTWYVPLPHNCQLLFIDIPELGYIEKNKHRVISEVSHLQQIDNKIFARTYSNKYFLYHTMTNELKEFATENDLVAQNNNINPKLISAIEFYSDKRNDIAGFALIIVGIISLLISTASMYATRKLVCLLIPRST